MLRFIDVIGKFRTSFIMGVLLAGALAMSACAPLIVGTAAGGAAVAASEERGFGGFVSDFEIQATINRLWVQHSVDLLRRLDMTVDSGRVLLLGRAKDAQQRLDAVRLAWQANGVKEVINEIQIEDPQVSFTDSTIDSAKDTWISTQIRSQITFNMSISSQNYTIDTVGGVVYIMGIAKSQAELDAVLQIARSVSGVQRVVSYVQLSSALKSAAPANSP